MQIALVRLDVHNVNSSMITERVVTLNTTTVIINGGYVEDVKINK